MKVSIKKETNIIDIPEEGAAHLTEITPSGHFKYELSYRVDPRAAVQNKAILVKIYASSKPFTKQPTRLLTQFNPDQLIKNLLQKTSINKDQGRAQISNVFFTYTSDISAKIPNDKTGLLSFRPKIQGVIPNVTLGNNKLVVLKSVQEITDTNIIMPVLENNISTAIVSSMVPRSTGVSKTVSQNLTQRGVDPAQVSGARTQTIQSARKVSGGIVSQPSRITGRLALNETQRVSLVGNLVNNNNPLNHLQLRPTDLVNVIVDSPRTTLDIKETLEIPTGLLQANEFFFILQLVNNVGVEIQTINVSVPHAKNVANLQIPVLPPKMAILQTGLPGKNVIQVKQVDPNATGVAVYRKEIKKGVPVIDAAYTFIGNLQARFGQDFQRLEDVVNNYNTIIYRAIPFNPAGVLASEFESAGAQALKNKKQSGKYDRRHNFVSIIGDVVTNAISVEIRDVPPGVCLVKLLKRNLSIFEQDFSLVAKPSLVTNLESGAPIFVTDNDVKEDRIYEYRVELLYPDGDIEIGANNLIIKYEPATANIVETTVSKPTVVQTGADIDVQFDLSSSLIPGDLDFIKKTLEAQGLLSFYQDGISQEKEKLQSIIAYGVRRINVTTSESEDFGIITDKNFSDRKFGPVKSVKPLQGGYEYKYLITTYFRKAETTLEQVTRTVQFTQNIAYTFKPAKWLHPLTLKRGNLTTDKTRTKNHSQTVFSFGAVGNITTANVSLANILPSITEARAQKLGKNSNLVQWRVQGQVTKIDHFIIILEMVGMRTVVGKSHNVSESNYFQFVDPLDNGEHGNLTYYIVPVFYDFTRGTEVSTNEVVV